MVQILIIDDDPIIRMVLKRALQEQSYEVLVAQNGEEGITQILDKHPALIICDWQMPGMDGLAVCRQVKANPSLSTTFFILLTSRSAVNDRIQGLDTGADEFLAKPIDVSELRARVRAGLRVHQSAQELQKLAADLQTQKQTLEAELTEAADYVRSLLPKPLTGSVSINSQFLPSRQLGGDCFDYYWLDPDYLMIYLLDISGHGLGSALPSVAVHNLLRSQSLPGVNFYQPSQVLSALNETFQMDEQHDRYFTIWYGIYNQQRRQLTYASAGHPPAILVSSKATDLPDDVPHVKRLKTRGTPIGMLPDANYINGSCIVEHPSTLYIFSDGVYEIVQADGSIWSLDDFVTLITRCNGIENGDTLAHILQQVQSINNSDTFEDDCSLLQVKLS